MNIRRALTFAAATAGMALSVVAAQAQNSYVATFGSSTSNASFLFGTSGGNFSATGIGNLYVNGTNIGAGLLTLTATYQGAGAQVFNLGGGNFFTDASLGAVSMSFSSGGHTVLSGASLPGSTLLAALVGPTNTGSISFGGSQHAHDSVLGGVTGASLSDDLHGFSAPTAAGGVYTNTFSASGFFQVTGTTAPVPELSSMIAFGGLALGGGLLGFRRRRK